VTLGSFLAVYILIALRGTRKISLPVWTSMAMGAAFLVESGTMAPTAALSAVDLRVVGVLFGMFTIVTAMETSAFLRAVAKHLLSLSTTPTLTVFAIVFGGGLLSAVLVNATIALMWTPVVIGVAAQLCVEATPLLIALAFGITIGSVMTPIGNPQNLLVAGNGAWRSPMVSFPVLFDPSNAHQFVLNSRNRILL
jgi:Na+/H+ antiporter NhaD/arsenite permease-like protein